MFIEILLKIVSKKGINFKRLGIITINEANKKTQK